jgi:hypothetical protein
MSDSKTPKYNPKLKIFATFPKGEQIKSMVKFQGKLYVATCTSVYIVDCNGDIKEVVAND